MIPKGVCRCLKACCNNKDNFRADEVLYRIPLESPRRVETTATAFSWEDSDDISASADRAVENILDDQSSFFDSDEKKYEFVSMRELAENDTVYKANASIRLKRDECTEPYTIGGATFYKGIKVVVRCGDSDEKIYDLGAHERYCPFCKTTDGINESMGFIDQYLVMLYGSTNSGKTSWLFSSSKVCGKATIAGWELNDAKPHDKDSSIANLRRKEGERTVEDRQFEEKVNKKLSSTDQYRPQETLLFHHLLKRGNEEIGFIFRDVAGENLAFSKDTKPSEYAYEARQFAKIADGILVFRDFTCLPEIVARFEYSPDNCVSPTTLYQEQILSAAGITDSKETEKSFKNHNIAEELEYLQLPIDRKFAAMYVINKTDMMQKIINISVRCDSNNGEDVIPFDFRCDRYDNDTVLTKTSAMFTGVYHGSEFDMSGYTRCAVETAHFINSVDRSFFSSWSAMMNKEHICRGITAITALFSSTDGAEKTRGLEPFAWLVEALVNKNNVFTHDLIHQYLHSGAN